MPGNVMGYGPAPGVQTATSGQVARSSQAQVVDAQFVAWVVAFGVVLPLVILGSLQAAKFRFVFIGRS